jgi:sterol desaturase/sphingolipid hydroxylase (fatty acid hydroxylase superfamily)
MSAYIYPIALALISVFVMTLEYFFPKREQKQLRKWLWSDVVHLVFNGHFLGVIIFGLSTYYVLPFIDTWLQANGWFDSVHRNAATTWPVWVQIIVAIVVIDFVQWCVHNLLHRVPFLWEFHKTHHSVKDGEMDWIVSFRFQWTEVMVYKAIQYLPLAWFGFHPYAVITHAVFGTLIGHLNHANLDWDWGPLKYVLNSPNMHIWHHDYEGDTHTTVNFGIIFSTWDWIFGTAKMPDHDPPHIGFHGVEEFPESFFEQALWPIRSCRKYLPAAENARRGLFEGAKYVRSCVLHRPRCRCRLADSEPAGECPVPSRPAGPKRWHGPG